jgi:hypothetical protein
MSISIWFVRKDTGQRDESLPEQIVQGVDEASSWCVLTRPGRTVMNTLSACLPAAAHFHRPTKNGWSLRALTSCRESREIATAPEGHIRRDARIGRTRDRGVFARIIIAVNRTTISGLKLQLELFDQGADYHPEAAGGALGSAFQARNEIGSNELSTMPKSRPVTGAMRTQPNERASIMPTNARKGGATAKAKSDQDGSSSCRESENDEAGFLAKAAGSSEG